MLINEIAILKKVTKFRMSLALWVHLCNSFLQVTPYLSEFFVKTLFNVHLKLSKRYYRWAEYPNLRMIFCFLEGKEHKNESVQNCNKRMLLNKILPINIEKNISRRFLEEVKDRRFIAR